MEPPNILLIMVDQMTAGAIGALGHPAAITPNLDRLVRGGVAFVNAYCNSPICVPARASLMTGKLARRTGVFDNGSELPAAAPTLAHHLGRAGYNTILSGKMHFVGPDQLHGFNERLTGDISLSGLTLTPDWSRGAYANEGSSVRRLEEPALVDWNLQLAFDEEVLSCALARLRKLRQEDDRFFLCASFSHPHDPFRITREYWDRYDGVSIPPPRSPAKPLDAMHPYNRWIQVHHEADRFPLDEKRTAAARRAYLSMVSYVDDHVGRLLGELERLGMDDTLVIFTSDHGEMLGEHGMWFKRTFFDSAAKVPLLFSLPGRLEPVLRYETVSLVDLTATLLDIADAPGKEEWIAEMDGDSFRPLLTGAGAGWKDSAICEYYGEGAVEPMLFLRKGRWKYVHVHAHEPLLFDLASDPDETRNLAGLPTHAELRRAMEAELLAGLVPAELRARFVRSQRERLAILEAVPDQMGWAHRPRRDALKLYGRAKR
jgi:choline-sulfatase